MACEYLGAERWLYDWQTLIGGGLALLAGVVAVVGTYFIGRSQVRAIIHQSDLAETENARLRQEGRRERAQHGLAAVRLLNGVIARNEDGMTKLGKALDQPNYRDSDSQVPRDWRQGIILKTDLQVVWATLGICSRDVVHHYLILDMRLTQFSSSEIFGSRTLITQLEEIRKITDGLKRALDDEKKHCDAVLAEITAA